jgi:ABC-type phosphate transport system substrate-binding protein
MMLRNRVLLGTTATLALLAAGAAHAQSINGGGSTLASPTYESAFLNYESANPSVDFSGYAPSGSGAAITAVLANKSNVSPPGPTPFDFGASDATITDANLQSWNASTTGPDRASAGLLVQIPSIGTPITVPFNFATVASNTAINLTDAQLCGIYSGKIINTSDPLLSGSGVPSSNSALHVVYRFDNSGTTFLFTQHLAAVCTSSTSSITFFATQAFASLFTTVPATFVTGSGSPGVQASIDGTPNSVGYLSPDYTREIVNPTVTRTTPAPYVAEVNGIAPTATNTQAALATGTPATDPAVNPNGTLYNPVDPVSFVPVAAKPSTGYPIVGYTTIVLPQCFADAGVATNLKAVISDLYRNAAYENLVRGNGFTPLPSNLANTIVTAYLLPGGTATSTINGVGAGSPGMCASVVGR